MMLCVLIAAAVLTLGGKPGKQAPEVPLPAGYAHLTQHALDREPWRRDDKTGGQYVKIKGDFDGDGKRDEVEIIRDVKEDSFVLMVHLQRAKQWIEGAGVGDSYFDIGLRSVSKGRYLTACGKGEPGACDGGKPKSFDLKTDGIKVFWRNSSEVLYYWNAKANKLDFVTLSYP